MNFYKSNISENHKPHIHFYPFPIIFSAPNTPQKPTPDHKPFATTLKNSPKNSTSTLKPTL